MDKYGHVNQVREFSNSVIFTKVPRDIWRTTHPITLLFGIISAVAIVGTVGCQFAFAINMFPGTVYLSGWIAEFNIMYMTFALSAIAFLWATCVAAYANTKDHAEARPWQYTSEVKGLAYAMTTNAILTIVSLAVYAFNVGDQSNFCPSGNCQLEAFVTYKITAALFMMCLVDTLSAVCKLVYLFHNRWLASVRLTPEQMSVIANVPGTRGA